MNKILDTIENVYLFTKWNIINLILIVFFGWLLVSWIQIGIFQTYSNWNAFKIFLDICFSIK